MLKIHYLLFIRWKPSKFGELRIFNQQIHFDLLGENEGIYKCKHNVVMRILVIQLLVLMR